MNKVSNDNKLYFKVLAIYIFCNYCENDKVKIVICNPIIEDCTSFI